MTSDGAAAEPRRAERVVCLFVCLFVRSFVGSFVRSSVRRVRVVGGGCARLLSTVLQPIEMLANGPPWMIAKLFSIVCARAGDQTNKQTNKQTNNQPSKQTSDHPPPAERGAVCRTHAPRGEQTWRRADGPNSAARSAGFQKLSNASRNFKTLPETSRNRLSSASRND